METSLDPTSLAPLVARPASPEEASPWWPVHTVYGGAQRFSHDVVARVGRNALALLDTLAGSLAELRSLPFGLDAPLDDAALDRIHRGLRDKLTREPVEDYRVDFEDGFGPRSDAEEDRAVVEAATAMARAHREEMLPKGIGLRVKALSGETAVRSARTLDGFLTTLAKANGGASIEGMVVTLPEGDGAPRWPR
ncbi:MAG: hypothetical protein IPN17_18720 [Deltaproteobacteria bacterium]|nr:hypothetical protein [Deltaproteobacteria bacterium]